VVVVPTVPIITLIQPVVATQPIVMNPFGSIFCTPGYNIQSIPTKSIPFSYGMPNFTLQFSFSISASNPNTSIGLGGMAPLHILASFVGSHIPQMNPMVGILPPFHPRSNPSLNVPSFTLTSSTPIPTNMFGMTNPPLSSIFTLRGVQFHNLGNPQPRATPAGGNV
jgi:hypothetical protein